MKLSKDFNGADLRNVCTEAGTDYTDIVHVWLASWILLLE